MVINNIAYTELPKQNQLFAQEYTNADDLKKYKLLSIQQNRKD